MLLQLLLVAAAASHLLGPGGSGAEAAAAAVAEEAADPPAPAPTNVSEEQQQEHDRDAPEARSASGDWDSLGGGLQVMYSAYQQCEQQEDLISCLKLRALRSADRALRQERVPLFGGLAFVRDPNQRNGRQLVDRAPPLEEEAFPADADSRAKVLDGLLLDRVERFFRSHSLQAGEARLMGDAEDLTSPAEEEGRKKSGKGLKKYGGALLMGLMMKSGLMAMAWKGVALLAGKALLVAKVALVLSAIVALKKLSHGGHGEEKTFTTTAHDYGGHYESSGGGGHYKRSLDPAAADRQAHRAHLLAFRAHPPHAHYHVRPAVEVRYLHPHPQALPLLQPAAQRSVQPVDQPVPYAPFPPPYPQPEEEEEEVQPSAAELTQAQLTAQLTAPQIYPYPQ